MYGTQDSYREPPRIDLSRLARRLERPVGQHPDGLRRALPRCHPGDVVAATLHKRDRVVVKGVLERDVVGDQLVVQPRLGQRFRGTQPLVEDVDDALHRGRDDATAACGAGDEIQRSVRMCHHDGRDRRQRPLTRSDVVGWRGHVSKGIGRAWNREVCIKV